MYNSSPADAILADAHIPQEICFLEPVSPRALNPRAIFVTGATGLVASFLIDDLMRKSAAIVYCLVRGSDAETRLARHLRRCGLCQGDLHSRIRVISGDISQPRFGMSEGAFKELAGAVDAIYHCAGQLNMAYPYARLKPVNVNGTLEVLRLAGLVCTKPVHYLSSMVVFFSEAHVHDTLLRETDTPRFHASLKGGYSEGKWVADRLVAAAQERGLPACIYRPVRIMGHTKTGATNDLNDVLPLLLKSCILLGKAPAFDIEVTMVPVDYVTGAIEHLSRQESAWGKAYHFFHPGPIAWPDLIEIVGSLGYPLEVVPYEEWWRDLKRAARDPKNTPESRTALSTTVMVLTAPHFLFFKRPPLDSSQLNRAVEGTGIECPPIDQALMGTYLRHWQDSGFIPPARGILASVASAGLEAGSC
jgi:thioester reductase-like protein